MQLSNLERRLAKVERLVADRARREKLANCNCGPQDPESGLIIVSDSRQLEAEMNLTCPAHGFRCLGQVMVIRSDEEDETFAEESVRLAKLFDEYERRLFAFRKSHPESEYVCQEL